MKNLQIIFFALILAAGLASCSGSSLKPKPSAFGKLNHIAVVADEDVWEGAVGDTFRYYFTAPFLLLPQPEPIFDLRHFTPEELRGDPLRRELHNYVILANLEDADSPTTQLIQNDLSPGATDIAAGGKAFGTKVGIDKWAKDQIVVYLFGKGEEAVMQGIQEGFSAINNRIRKSDLKQLAANTYQSDENVTVQEKILQIHGVQMRIPGDYIEALHDDKFLWLRKDTRKTTRNIFVYRLPYTSQEQLTKEGLRTIRDTLGRKYVSTESPNTYMRTNDVDLPLFITPKSLDGKYALEGRGIWDIVNDFMGGAFISLLVHDADNNELLFVDGFLHAPGEEKRDIMQELELIIDSVRF